MNNRYIYPSRLRELFFRRVKDYRIATINTVDHIGTKSRSIVVFVHWVGSQKALYIFGRRVWLNKRARRNND